MIDVRNTFLSGLDLDTSHYQVKKDAYIDAYNITRDAVESGHDFNLTNIVGNQIVPYNYPTDGVVLGGLPNTIRNTVIFCRYGEDGYSGVYEYDRTNGVINKIFECITDSATDILGFTPNGKIFNLNIYNRPEGDLLFFLDSQLRPTTLNITRFKAGQYTPVTRDIIDVHKRPPLPTPDCVYDNDATIMANTLRNRLFKLQYLWVYDDFEESTLGPESAMPKPDKILDDEFTNVVTNNNVIRIVMNSGPKNVKAVKLLMSFVEKTNSWSDFAVVETIDKEELGIADDTDFTYSFYNESTYPTYEVARRIQLYDYVPQGAISQEMPNGNVLAYAGVTEGLDRTLTPNVEIDILTVAAGSGSTIGSLNAVSTFIEDSSFPEFQRWAVTFSGIPATGTIVNVRLRRISDSTPVLIGTYTTISTDGPLNVAGSVNHSIGVINIAYDETLVLTTTFFSFDPDIYEYLGVEIIPPGGGAETNSIATWPFSTQRRIGLQYFNQKGVTNGVLYDAQIVFPAYAENGSQQVLIPYINLKIFHIPPVWAHSYSVVVTQEGTQYLYWEAIDVNVAESEYRYFEITNMALNATKNPTVAAVLSWTFQDGDRMRLIRRMSDDTVFNYTYDAAIEGIVVDPIIDSVPQTGKTFVKIKNVAPFDAVDYSSDFFIIQLYRPVQQQATDELLTYFEFGVTYPVMFPETSSRVHGGQLTNQDPLTSAPAEINIYEGDAYFRSRTVYLSETGFGIFNVQDRNFVDFYISAVNSISGRPTAIDENLKETFFGAVIRYGQAYQPNTNINGLKRFSSLSFFECDYSFGNILRMKVWDRSMRVFQQYKVGVIPLFSQINKSPSGNSVEVYTDQLLNPIQYYQGNYGIGEAPGSLASYNNSDFFCDTNRGIICRVAQNGVTPISVLYKVNSWATSNLPLRVNGINIYGIYDPKSNNYIIHLEQAELPDVLSVGIQENFAYSGLYGVSETLVGVCAATPITLYYPVPFAVGIPLFTDSSFNDLLVDYSYVVGPDGLIYNVDQVTGIVGTATGFECGIGVPFFYRLSVLIGDACAAPTTQLYTENPFAIGEILYYDSSLATPVTTYNYVVFQGGTDIYELDPVTGEVGAATGSSCFTGVAGDYILGNNLATICSDPEVTLYTSGAFSVGGFLFSDSSLSIEVVGYDYAVNMLDGNVYALNNTTGQIGMATGNTCPPGDNFHIINDSAVGVIDDVTPHDYLINSGSFPLATGETIDGEHDGITALLTVHISGTPTASIATLYKNGVSQEAIPITTAGSYPFELVVFTITDILLIRLSD